MNDFNTPVGASAETDVGLKNFMLGTYRYMAMAMLVTAGVAYVSAPFLIQTGIFQNSFAILAFVIAIPILFGAVGAKLPTMSKGGMLTFLFGFAAFMGLFVSAITIAFPAIVLAKVFFMTVALFGALSLFGYTTKTDLTPYLVYAGIGFMVYVGYMLLSMFIPSIAPVGMFETIVLAVALVFISVITAGKTQMLKRTYYGAYGDTLMLDKLSAYGAAMLLLSFINMFQILLSLFGRE